MREKRKLDLTSSFILEQLLRSERIYQSPGFQRLQPSPTRLVLFWILTALLIFLNINLNAQQSLISKREGARGFLGFLGSSLTVGVSNVATLREVAFFGGQPVFFPFSFTIYEQVSLVCPFLYHYTPTMLNDHAHKNKAYANVTTEEAEVWFERHHGASQNLAVGSER